jgi:hypothetical protein
MDLVSLLSGRERVGGHANAGIYRDGSGPGLFAGGPERPTSESGRVGGSAAGWALPHPSLHDCPAAVARYPPVSAPWADGALAALPVSEPPSLAPAFGLAPGPAALVGSAPPAGAGAVDRVQHPRAAYDVREGEAPRRGLSGLPGPLGGGAPPRVLHRLKRKHGGQELIPSGRPVAEVTDGADGWWLDDGSQHSDVEVDKQPDVPLSGEQHPASGARKVAIIVQALAWRGLSR